ncbi:hypothetical protein PFTANZ_06549, partial [Plasmodium falciparum Tanzania (2000708)]
MASSTTYSSAKELLDKIGQKVYEEVKNAAKQYIEELKGDLSQARFEDAPETQQTPSGPCSLNYEYHTNVTKGGNKEYPCRDKDTVRFSDTEGAQCDKRKIRDNDKKNKGGACAPYRRLHLCDYNLENISDFDHINNHTLLVDVCLAALHEGQSIRVDHDKYKLDKDNSGSKLCTELARSFADIGDIVRGRDLYRGNNGKDELQDNLKKIFKEIYDKLLEDNKTSGNNKDALKTRYNDNEENYYKLREDWWTANRHTVWEAITCDVKSGNNYFRRTCGGGSPTKGKCRCDGDVNIVPTYFDYVPQYLRWFEEWAEDFCRKKNKKLKDVKTNCREQDKSGTERYCDRDGFDCERTIYKKGYFVIDKDCNTCSVWCRMYESWIDNQKKEFLKQKEKYTKEITSGGASGGRSGNGMTKGGAGGETATNYEGYEKKFYDELQSNGYGTIDKFLNLLSKEKECENIKDTEGGGKIDFKNVHGDAGGTAGSCDSGTNDINNGTFYHSKYCQPCPICGVKKESDGQFVNRTNDDAECKEEKEEYKIPPGVSGTKINVLYSGKGRGDITKKLEEFCKASPNDKGTKNEEWECYYNSETENKCRMKKAGANDQGHDKIMSFNHFFNFWVGHVLNDSIDWRTQLTKCLSEDKLKKCEKGCKSKCECFKKWIEKKEKEWEKIKEHFNTQEDIPEGLSHYKLLETILEDYYFINIQKAYGDLKSIQEMKKMINENKKNTNRSKGDVDALDVLFDHELEEAEDCLDIHEDDDDDDECVEESEKIPNNPCSGESGGSGSSSVLRRYPAVATKVAQLMHDQARQQLTSRAGRRTLKADASKGTYSNLGQGNQLKDICKITNNHSNAIGDSKDPCNGKGDGLQIGETWEQKHSRDTTNGEFYLPPRRQHMCTSNLERLQVDSVINTRNGRSPGDSLLVDVMLAANKQAERIKKNYKDPNGQNNHKGKCRAMKYSFADIGDIIKGTDLWEKNRGEKDTQNKLVQIFQKIKENLNGIETSKYTNTDGKHTQLRYDWWTANRRQVWRAMKCATKNGNIPCHGMPVDDYIPQRLRWMTEWAEWYCKAQNKYYGELLEKCGSCMGNIEQCTNDKDICISCKAACDTYKEKIKKWQDQWNTMEIKYLTSYRQAKNGSDGIFFHGAGPDYKQVVDFLSKLHRASVASSGKGVEPTRNPPSTTPNTPYETAAGYIHQEIGNVGCNIQNEFCFKKNGVIPTTGSGTNNKNYAFKNTPKDHDEACECESRKPGVPPKKKEDACTIVETLLHNRRATDDIDGCNRKYKDPNYPGWECEKKIQNIHEGACMPPRRQNLYIYNLKNLNGTSETDLRKAFIECAAIETFFSWHEYKEDKKREEKERNEEAIYLGPEHITLDKEAQNQLDGGTIPEEFKHQMFYTFGDYRDLCLGKDITNDVSDVENNINKVLPKSGQTSIDQKRKEFWETNGKSIWQGMLCALCYDTNDKTFKDDVHKNLIMNPQNNTYKYDNVSISGGLNGVNTTKLKKFACRPQFLRWFQEWSEEFCQKKKNKINKIQNECRGKNQQNHCDGDGFDCKEIVPNDEGIIRTFNCASCAKSCISYKQWISRKKDEFHKQREKYDNKINKTQRNNHHNDDNVFYKNLQQKYPTVKKFMEALKVPCSNNNSGDSKIDFNEPDETFRHTQFCDPCPVFGVKCKKVECRNPTLEKCNQYTFITTDDMGKMEKPIEEFDIFVTDNSAIEFKHDLDLCRNIGIFEGIRKDEWKCGYVCGYDVCKLKNFDEKIHDKQYILIRTLYKNWLENFLKDYNEINNKISHCMNNGKGNICINGCKKKCNCVDKWINNKSKEWGKVRERYFKQYKINDSDNSYTVRSFLESMQPENEVQKVKGKNKGLSDLEETIECYGTMNSKNRVCKKKNVVESLLNKLKEKIKTCPNEPDSKPDQTCVPFSPVEETTSPSDDDDETSTDNDAQKPAFCPKEVRPPAPKEPGVCERVKALLDQSNGGIKPINDCNPKINRNTYPGWDCKTETMNSENNGACMPPRRQILCIHDLKVLTNTSSEEDLRKAFIQCAAIETFWLWQKYKKDKNGGDADTKLNSGTIPEEFKRQMFYTFCDYRDLCLGKDIGNDSGKDISGTVTTILNSDKVSETKTTPKDWWDKNGPKIWEGMVCALEKAWGKDTIKNNNTYSLVKFSGSDNPLTLEEFAKTPQFLRWFIEWGDEFCQEHKVEKERLLDKCNKVDCSKEDESNKTIKKECEKACTAYEQWIKDWKDQYNKQNEKFDKEKKEDKYKNTPAQIDADDSYSAREYLHEQLEKLCANGNCSCMENPSTQDDETDLPGQNDLPEALDYPPQEIGDKCECSEPSEPMSCVEKTARKLRKDAQKNVERFHSSLKGNGEKYKGKCNLINKQNNNHRGNNCDFNTRYPNAFQSLDVSCDNNGKDRFKIGVGWKCDGDSSDGKNKLCIPPRRKDMCLKKFEDIRDENINGSTELLTKIQEIAQNEGDDIIKNLLPENACKESIICDAMKYSFADIGDIIRGRIRIKPNNDYNIEGELQNIFRKIQNNTTSLKTIDLTLFREKWWDANRKEVWKAMTCNVPNDALLKKKLNNPADKSPNTDKQTEQTKKCGHNSEPPDYDYIPERYRFLQEWSEYYCKALKEKNDEIIKECEQCNTQNGTKCDNEKDKEKCKECNDKCEEYKNIVDKWQSQFTKQNEIYKTLYIQDRAHGNRTTHRDPSIKFTKKLEETCDNPHSAEEYLDKSTHCTDYKFSETNSNGSNYAFSKYPTEYEKA